MANFRLERLFVMLDEPIPGLDHLNAVDAEEFVWLHSDQVAIQLAITPLSEFMYAPFQQPEWYAATEGLESIRDLIKCYKDWISQGSNPYSYTTEVLEGKVQVLSQVEAILVAADSHDRQFYFAARDLN